MSAIRLARGFTGRDTIVKFEGCYRDSDSLLSCRFWRQYGVPNYRVPLI